MFSRSSRSFFAFLPALDNGFVKWDDDVNFLLNPYYRGLGWTQIRWMFTTFYMGPYQPLSWLTLGLDFKLWGMDPRGYHLTNVLIHAVNAALAFFLARKLFEKMSPGRRTLHYDIAAAAAALFFAVHPLRVESVAWATERRDVLSGFFYLATLLLYWRAAVDVNGRKWRWIAAALAAFTCALLSKAIVVTLPLVLILFDVYVLRRTAPPWNSAQNAGLAMEKVPFFALSAIFGVVGLIGQRGAAKMRALQSFGVVDRLAQSAYGLTLYLWKTLAPINLLPLYELPKHFDPYAPRFLGSIALVAAATGWLWARRKNNAGLWAAWLYFIATLLPVLGLVQFGLQIAADRYTYLASLGLAALFGGGLLHLMAEDRPAAPTIAAGFLILFLGGLARAQCRVWRNTESLWTNALLVDPNVVAAQNNLGLEFAEQGKIPEAVARYEEALRLDPDCDDAHNNLGEVLEKLNRTPEAIAQYREALRINPNFPNAYNNLGSALMALGQTDPAIAVFQEALRRDPSNAMAQDNWADALAAVKRYDEALIHYRAAIQLRPDFVYAYNNMGVTFMMMGRLNEAMKSFRAALALNPRYEHAASNLARASAAANR